MYPMERKCVVLFGKNDVAKGKKFLLLLRESKPDLHSAVCHITYLLHADTQLL